MRCRSLAATSIAVLLPAPVLAAGPADTPLPAGAIARFGTTRFQHPSIGGAVAFSPDGKRLATAGYNVPDCVWEAATGKLLRTYVPVGSTLGLKWKADGKLAVLAYFGPGGVFMHEWGAGPDDGPGAGRIQELRAAAAKVERKGFRGPTILSPDARRVLMVWNSYDRDSQAEVFPFSPNLPTELVEAERSIPLGKGRHDIWLSGDGKTLIVSQFGAKGGERIAAFDLSAKKEQEKPAWEFTYPSPGDHRLTHCLSADGKQVVLQFLNGDMELWDGPAGKLVRDLPKAPGGDFHWGGEHPGLGLSPDGKRLAIATRQKNGEIGGQVIDPETGKKLVTLAAGPMPWLAGGLAFSPDGKRLALASHGFVRVWDAETGRDIHPPTGHRGPINSIVASPDGKTVATAGADMTVRAWDPATGQEKWKVALPQPVLVSFTTADAVVVEYAPSFHLTGGLREPLLDLATGKARALPGDMAKATRGTPPQSLGPVVTYDNLITIAPDGKSAVTLEPQQPALRVWSWPEGKLRKTLPLDVPKDLVVMHARARVTPKGKDLVSVTHCRLLTPAPSGPGDAPLLIDRWDMASGKRLDRKERNLVQLRPVWTPDGSRLLAVWDEGEIKDAFSGKLVRRLPHSNTDPFSVSTLSGMTLSPDGKRIAVGGEFFHAGTVRVFDMQTGALVATLPAGGRGRLESPTSRMAGLSQQAKPRSSGRPMPRESRRIRRSRDSLIPTWRGASATNPTHGNQTNPEAQRA